MRGQCVVNKEFSFKVIENTFAISTICKKKIGSARKRKYQMVGLLEFKYRGHVRRGNYMATYSTCTLILIFTV